MHTRQFLFVDEKKVGLIHLGMKQTLRTVHRFSINSTLKRHILKHAIDICD